MKWLFRNAQRIIFGLISLFFFVFGVWSLFHHDFFNSVTPTLTLFGLAFLSFIISDLPKFKRIKGFGLEVEQWEKTQKEAESLVIQLKSIVAIYSKEIIRSKVLAGRFGAGGSDWKSRWKLYHDILSQHQSLNQDIDFSESKKLMDDYFLHDLIYPQYAAANKVIRSSREQANKLINKRFGSPITDADGYAKAIKDLRELPTLDSPFELILKRSLCKTILESLDTTVELLNAEYDINIDIESSLTSNLKRLQKVEETDDLKITEELIAEADKK